MKDFLQVMKALSDPNRVRLLKMLQVRPLCVCEIQAVLRIAQPTVSKHLKILESAGLVTSSKDGLWVNYSLSDGEKNPYAATLLGNLRHWLSGDPEVVPATGAACTVCRTEIQKKSLKRPGAKPAGEKKARPGGRKKPGRRPGRPRSLEG